MSETPHLRAVKDGEAPLNTESGPKRFKLSDQQWAAMNDKLRPYAQRSGGNVIGDEVLQFPSGTSEQSLGMTKILNGVMAATPDSYSGIAVSHIVFEGEDSKDAPTIYFPGILAPNEISLKAGRAMAEANLTLEAVQSPLRFPEQ